MFNARDKFKFIHTQISKSGNRSDLDTEFKLGFTLNNINVTLPKITSDNISVANYLIIKPFEIYFDMNYVKIPLHLHFTVTGVRFLPFLHFHDGVLIVDCNLLIYRRNLVDLGILAKLICLMRFQTAATMK